MAYNVSPSDIQYPIHPLVFSDTLPTSHYNIVCITLDSWNPRVLDSITMPNIWKITQQGQVFKNHFSSSNGTKGGIFGMFFGISNTYVNEFSLLKMSPVFIDRLIDLDYNIQYFQQPIFRRLTSYFSGVLILLI